MSYGNYMPDEVDELRLQYIRAFQDAYQTVTKREVRLTPMDRQQIARQMAEEGTFKGVTDLVDRMKDCISHRLTKGWQVDFRKICEDVVKGLNAAPAPAEVVGPYVSAADVLLNEEILEVFGYSGLPPELVGRVEPTVDKSKDPRQRVREVAHEWVR